MNIPTFLRNPAMLLSAVSGLIVLSWFALGWPVELPRTPLGVNEKLDCISYSPFRAGEFPAAGVVIPAQRIDEDLAKLAALASCVRTHSTGFGLDRLPALAQKRGMSVVLGISLSRDQAENKREIERAFAAVNASRAAIRSLVVGEGVLSRNEMSPAELATIIRSVRQSARVPVTYADNADTWLRASDIIGIVETITVNFEPYSARYPVSVASVQQGMRELRAKFASVYPGKEVIFARAGWPSEGRMRDGARASRADQAIAIQEMLAAGKAGNFRVHLFEAFDQPWRMRSDGTAAASMGLFEGDSRELKFRLGGQLSNHPYWFFQGVIGVMSVLVVFAAAFLGARSGGPFDIKKMNGLPVAAIALVSGLTIGEALTDAARQDQSFFGWIYAAFFVILAVAVPMICAVAAIRRVPFEGFASILDPLSRNLVQPFSRIVAAALILVTLAAIELALGLVFEPASREIQFAALTAPVVSLLVVSFANPPGERRDTAAEISAAGLLIAAAVFLFFSEGVLNWQALWFEALLVLLAWVLVRARGARTTG